MVTPSVLSLQRRAAAYDSWAATPDRRARTAPGTAASPASLEAWERKIDPAGELPAHERAQRAEAARKAYFTRLAIASAKARAARKQREAN